MDRGARLAYVRGQQPFFLGLRLQSPVPRFRNAPLLHLPVCGVGAACCAFAQPNCTDTLGGVATGGTIKDLPDRVHERGWTHEVKKTRGWQPVTVAMVGPRL